MKKVKTRSYRKMNSQAKLSFYVVRQRSGDNERISEATGFSTSQVSNVLAGRRTATTEITNEMFNISRRRLKTSELA
ncbi:MAG: hypothetical protein AABY22_11040 [Nanoarchaeota archaeon]|mgnify:CR=1 FL=1